MAKLGVHGCYAIDGQQEGSEMKQVGVRELRNNVSSLLRLARRGQRVIVTIDGEPVAQLGPIEPFGQPRLVDLIAAGLMIPAAHDIHAAVIDHDLPVDIAPDDLLAWLRQ